MDNDFDGYDSWSFFFFFFFSKEKGDSRVQSLFHIPWYNWVNPKISLA